jgi:hypothetical protein
MRSWQLPLIPPQNEQDALSILQLSGKDPTNGWNAAYFRKTAHQFSKLSPHI